MKQGRLLALAMLVASSAIAAPTPEQASPNANPAKVWLEEGQLHYAGVMDSEAVTQLAKLYESTTPKPDTLVIGSGGGDVTTGIALGEWVFDNHLSVQIDRGCASSCANYVFPAGKRKIIPKTAVLMFHGGMSKTEWGPMLADVHFPKGISEQQKAAALEDVKKGLADEAQKQAAFFKKIGVNEALTCYGHHKPYIETMESDDHYVGWRYDVATLARFGVTNVEVLNPPWQPKALRDGALVYTIHLDPNQGESSPDNLTCAAR